MIASGELAGSGWPRNADFPEIPEGPGAAMFWAKPWIHEHGFTVDDIRRELVHMDPLLVRRTLRSAKLQEERGEALYVRLQREALRRGEIGEAEMGRNIAAFGGVA